MVKSLKLMGLCLLMIFPTICAMDNRKTYEQQAQEWLDRQVAQELSLWGTVDNYRANGPLGKRIKEGSELAYLDMRIMTPVEKEEWNSCVKKNEQLEKEQWIKKELGSHKDCEDYRNNNSDYKRIIKEGKELSRFAEHVMDQFTDDKAEWRKALAERSKRKREKEKEQFTLFCKQNKLSSAYKAEVKKIDQECNSNQIKLQESVVSVQDAIKNIFELEQIALNLRIEEKKITKDLLKAIIMNPAQEKLAYKNIRTMSKEFNNYISGKNIFPIIHTKDTLPIMHTNVNNSVIIDSIKTTFTQFKNYFINQPYDTINSPYHILMTINKNNIVKRDSGLELVIPTIEEALKKQGIDPQYINIETITKNNDKSDGIGNAMVGVAAAGISYKVENKEFSNVNNAYMQSLNIEKINFYVGTNPKTKQLEDLNPCNIAHEIQHLKEAHGVKEAMLELYRDHYSIQNCPNEQTTTTIQTLMNQFAHIVETIADTLPCITDSELALSQKKGRARNMYMGDQVTLNAQHYKTLSTISELHEQNKFILRNYLNSSNQS